VFRNFPLNDIHPHAQHAAETAEAAAALIGICIKSRNKRYSQIQR
jgi:hypothetical protein